MYSFSRLSDLWTRIGAQSEPQPVHRAIIRLYTQPHRRYHCLDHLDHCLDQFDRMTDAGPLNWPTAVETALIFHDAVYSVDPRQYKDNEKASAEYARLVLTQAQVPTRLTEEVAKLIMLTTHTQTPEDHDSQAVVDIDLSPLGLSWKRFATNSGLIREEFGHLPDNVFWPPHREFLRRLLQRPRIYLTDFFGQLYEAQARANLSRYLTMTQTKGG